MAKAVKKGGRRRIEKKHIERGAAHICSSFNNTIVTITDIKEEHTLCCTDSC